MNSDDIFNKCKYIMWASCFVFIIAQIIDNIPLFIIGSIGMLLSIITVILLIYNLVWSK